MEEQFRSELLILLDEMFPDGNTHINKLRVDESFGEVVIEFKASVTVPTEDSDD